MCLLTVLIIFSDRRLTLCNVPSHFIVSLNLSMRKHVFKLLEKREVLNSSHVVTLYHLPTGTMETRASRLRGSDL